jgi:hypothetical protein
MKRSRRINVPEFSQTISQVNVKLHTNVSEISSDSIIRVDVVNQNHSYFTTGGLPAVISS